jgi:hypothetical protein
MDSSTPFENYVGIATHYEWQAGQLSDEDDFKSYEELEKLWTARITTWGAERPNDRTPFSKCKNLAEISLPSLFFEYPISGILLWNVMRSFYRLDRVVCGVLPGSIERVEEWESLPISEYLTANRVEKKWNKSLSNIITDIEKKYSSPVKGITKQSFRKGSAADLRKSSTWPRSLRKEETKKNSGIEEEADRRRKDILSGVDQLEKTIRILKKEFIIHSEDADISRLLVKEIELAANRRVSWLDTRIRSNFRITNDASSIDNTQKTRPSTQKVTSHWHAFC